MTQGLRKIIQNTKHDLELYTTLVICGFLLVLKLLHVVEDGWIFSAILITLMLLAVGSLRDRAREKTLQQTLDKITLKGSDESTLRWYMRRSDATLDMLNDMESFKHIVFMGVSQRELATYLRELLQHTSDALPWETVEIYFASPLLGEAYEGIDFHRNLIRARQDIACVLTEPAFSDRLRYLRTVSFFQNDGLTTHTGSMFGSSSQELSIIYSVHSAVYLYGDTHQGLTIRLTTSPGRGYKNDQFKHYEEIYRALSQSSVRLGVFSCSAWDLSARQWSEYARQSDVLARSASIVADMISPQNRDVVLDVGSGSGESASAILESHSDVSMVMLDGSPQMVRILRDKFLHESRVRCALCQLPSEDGGGIDIEGEEYSFIVVHQTLGELLKSFGNPDDFANWCRSKLKQNGQLLITAHNTLVNTIRPDDWSDWKDPFRVDFVKELRKASYKAHIRELQHIIDGEKIVRACERVGFKLEEKRFEVIGLNYEERRRLWHVPAVLESVVDTTKVRATDLNHLVDKAINLHLKEGTMPRTVVFWRFLYIDSG